MIIKFGSIVTIFLIFAFGWLSIVQAQQSSQKETSCQQSAKEILSEIDTVYNLAPVPDKILVAGEVYRPQLLTLETPFSLTQVIAIVGGFSRNASLSVYLLRQSTEGEEQTVHEIDLREIRMRRTKDLLLEKGDVVFVPRRYSHRETMPFYRYADKISAAY